MSKFIRWWETDVVLRDPSIDINGVKMYQISSLLFPRDDAIALKDFINRRLEERREDAKELKKKIGRKKKDV